MKDKTFCTMQIDLMYATVVNLSETLILVVSTLSLLLTFSSCIQLLAVIKIFLKLNVMDLGKRDLSFDLLACFISTRCKAV